MYLSRLSGCPKSRQRDVPSSGISLLGTKRNQQLLNLANTEGGRAQSLDCLTIVSCKNHVGDFSSTGKA